MNIEWIKEIIDTDSSRPILQQAYRIEVDGTQWVFATTTAVLYALEQQSNLPPCPDTASVHITDWLNVKPGTLATTVADLRAWAGKDTFQYCHACSEDEYWCEHCKGTGYINGHEERNGRINGMLINRWLVAKAFHNVPDGSVQVVISGPDNMVNFIGHGWRVIVMAMRYTTGLKAVTFDAWQESAECS